MRDQLISSLATLGIALSPALLKFASVSGSAELERDRDAETLCVQADDAPVHQRYRGRADIRERLAEGAVVQVLSAKKNWRHIAFVSGNEAGLGWITDEYLDECGPARSPKKETVPPSRKRGEAASGRLGTPRGNSSTLGGKPEKSEHLALGAPTDADPSDDNIVDHGIYVLSYNDRLRTTNWVAWKLTAEDLGDVDRKNDFRPDPELPATFYRITPADYKGTGFDQGHLCPSAHRTGSEETNSLTFLMTNMQPQYHSLNAGPWKSLETYERKLADDEGKELYVVAGGLFAKRPATIGNDVPVPKANYRITVVLDAGMGLADISEETPVYAVEMPNEPSASGHKWYEYQVNVDQIERDTGYDFLARLPDALEKKLEREVREVE